MAKNKRVSIYSYLDYRDYLRDYFKDRKNRHAYFSYRFFAQVAGYKSAGLLIQILKRKKNIGPDLLRGFSKAMGHNRKEDEYFKNLVHFNQAETTVEKHRLFERLLFIIRGKSKVVGTAQFKYYSRWYYPAVRELLSVINFKGNYKDITGRIRPTILLAQAKNAVNVLSKLGFIKRDRFGYYRAVDKHITSGSEIRTLALSNFQREMMDRGKEAIDRFPPAKREISTLTFSISSDALQQMKDEIKACRARLVEIITKSDNMDMVGQLNIQLFPLTKEQDD